MGAAVGLSVVTVLAVLVVLDVLLDVLVAVLLVEELDVLLLWYTVVCDFLYRAISGPLIDVLEYLGTAIWLWALVGCICAVAFATMLAVVAGLTLLWAPPLMAYLLSRDSNRQEWIGVIGLLLGVGTVPVVLGYAANGSLSGSTLILSAAITVPAMIFQIGGELIGRRIKPDRFRRYLLLMFLVLGLGLLFRAFFT